MKKTLVLGKAIVSANVYGLFALLTAASLEAQITMAAQIATPSSVGVSAGPHGYTYTVPVAQLGTGTWSQSAVVPGASAHVAYRMGRTSPNLVCELDHTATVTAASGTATTGPIDILLRYYAPTPTPLNLSVQYSDSTSPGFAVPFASVDVGNDGTIDYVNGVAVTSVPPLVAGTQPAVIRVFMESSVVQTGETTSHLLVEVTPDNNISVTPAVTGCTPTTVIIKDSSTSRGLSFERPALLPIAHFVMFGFSAQPILLPSPGPVPCLLLPSPDVAVALPVNGVFDLDIPASIRPISLYAQSVVIGSGGVQTGGGFLIDAQ